MSDRKMVEGLHHVWTEKDAKFFERIDETGGWPVGFKYVGFEHTDGRAAGFTNCPHGNGWWTIIADADDYYLWKVSDAGKMRFAEAVLGRVVRTISPNLTNIEYVNSRGRLTR